MFCHAIGSPTFTPSFELSTMETRCHRLFIGISVPGGHLHLTEDRSSSASGLDILFLVNAMFLRKSVIF